MLMLLLFFVFFLLFVLFFLLFLLLFLLLLLLLSLFLALHCCWCPCWFLEPKSCFSLTCSLFHQLGSLNTYIGSQRLHCVCGGLCIPSCVVFVRIVYTVGMYPPCRIHLMYRAFLWQTVKNYLETFLLPSRHASVPVVTLLIDTCLNFLPNINALAAQVSLATSLHLAFSVVWVRTHQDSANWLAEQGCKQSTCQVFLAHLMHVSCGITRTFPAWRSQLENARKSYVLIVCCYAAGRACVAWSVEPRWSIMIFHPTWNPSQNWRCICLHVERWWDHVLCRPIRSYTSQTQSWGGCIVVGKSAVSRVEIRRSIWHVFPAAMETEENYLHRIGRSGRFGARLRSD